MLSFVVAAAAGLSTGAGELVHQTLFYVIAAVVAGIVISLPLMAIGMAYAWFKANSPKPAAPVRPGRFRA